MIAGFTTLNSIPQTSLKLFSHILNAHHIWNARITGRTPEFKVWQEHDIQVLGDIHYENQRNSFQIISSTEDFEKRIDYDDTDGRLLTDTIKDILFHIINHSTNHRGQIVMDFKANGLDPLASDYIHYNR